MNITEFLQARIAEDEAVARAAGGPNERWDTMTEETSDGENIYYTVEKVGARDATVAELSSSQSIGRNQASHIARHDPARVLAECAAKRAIIEQAQKASEVEQEFDERIWAGAGPDRVEPWAGDAILFAIAAVYKDHPDYQQEWA